MASSKESTLQVASQEMDTSSLTNTNFSEWISSLFASTDHSDVELHIEVEQETESFVIPAHSFVLKKASKVFETMLEPGKFKEGTTGVAKVTVDGTKADAIAFVRFLYTKRLQILDVNSYVVVMQTADLFQMGELVKLCEKRIKGAITPFSVCNTYVVLRNTGVSSKELLSFCESLMLRFAFLIFNEKLHVDLTEETMIFLLGSEKLNILNEEQALQAVWDWGHSKCISKNDTDTRKLRDLLTKLLPLIKCHLIGHLENKSLWSIFYPFYEMNSKNPTAHRKTDNLISLSFSAHVLNLSEFGDTLEVVTISTREALITFTVKRTLFLTGFDVHIYCSTNADVSKILPFNVSVNTEHIESTGMSFKTMMQKTVTHQGSCYMYCVFSVDFPKPVLIRNNIASVIYLNKNGNCQLADKRKLKPEIPWIVKQGSDDEASFTVKSPVIGLTKLSYFLQS